jgi:ParB family chromosome partitioning protein
LPDEKLTEFALRLVLTGHKETPRANDFDFLAQAEAVFVLPQPRKKATANKHQPMKGESKPSAKKETPPKKKLAA